MIERRKIALEETIYCWIVAAFAMACIFCVVVFEVGHERPVMVIELAGFCWLALCALFPLGILVEIKQLRLWIPRPVAFCLLLTGLNVCLLVQYYWWEISRFLATHRLV